MRLQNLQSQTGVLKLSADEPKKKPEAKVETKKEKLYSVQLKDGHKTKYNPTTK